MVTMTYTYADGQVKLTPIRINGVTIPCPSEWQTGKSDLQKNAERNADGYLVADLVRSNVEKHELRFAFLLPEDLAKLETLLSHGMWKTMDYMDKTGDLKTITVYKGDLSYTPKRILETGEIQGYIGVAVNLIER